MYCVILFGGFPTEVHGPFNTEREAKEWFRVHYNSEQGAVIRFRKAN